MYQVKNDEIQKTVKNSTSYLLKAGKTEQKKINVGIYMR